jgi:hypothetical protein
MKALSGKHKVKKQLISTFAAFLFMSISTVCLAAIPLITDDTGTQGKGKFQVEVLGEYSSDKEHVAENEPWLESQHNGVGAAITYGITDAVDIVFALPYQFMKIDQDNDTQKENGFADSAVEAKWRFFEKDGFSLAAKPGITLPTGNENKGLGAGRSTYYLYLVGSKESGPWAFHSNIAYIRNENKNDGRKDIWFASLATTFEVLKGLKLVGDMGVESNADRSSTTAPAYILGGFIYSPLENFDIGLGVKGGLTKPEADLAIRGGVTWRF